MTKDRLQSLYHQQQLEMFYYSKLSLHEQLQNANHHYMMDELYVKKLDGISHTLKIIGQM